MNTKELLDALRRAPMTAQQITEAYAILGDRRSQSNRQLMNAFNFGDRVTFNGRGRRIEGRVQKSNIKTVSVLSNEGVTWRVPPSMLQRA